MTRFTWSFIELTVTFVESLKSYWKRKFVCKSWETARRKIFRICHIIFKIILLLKTRFNYNPMGRRPLIDCNNVMNAECCSIQNNDFHILHQSIVLFLFKIEDAGISDWYYCFLFLNILASSFLYKSSCSLFEFLIYSFEKRRMKKMAWLVCYVSLRNFSLFRSDQTGRRTGISYR